MGGNQLPTHILVPTDFSDFGTAALEYAARLAGRFGARLSLLFADEFVPPIDFIEAPASFYMETLPETRKEIEERLRGFLAQHVPPEVPCEAKVVAGAPSGTIISVAEADGADLIVMGTHGRHGWRRLLLGSVTENVLRRSKVPVLTTRAGAALPEFVAKILCPVNNTAIARCAVQEAVSWAVNLDAELVFAQVIEGTSHRYLSRDALRSWVPDEAVDHYSYITLEKSDYTSEQIIGLAAEAKADLIVIGAQHKRFLDTTVIGTTSERVTRFANTPVLTVIGQLDERGEAVDQHTFNHRHSSFPPVLR